MPLLPAFLIGTVAGSRSMTAPAAVSLAFAREWLTVPKHSRFGLLGRRASPWVLAALAAAELVVDQLPSTPSRKKPAPFAARIASGALSGAAVGASASAVAAGLVAGAAGAVVGTLYGYKLRQKLSELFGADVPAALIEDAVALAAAVLAVRIPGGQRARP
jgi:uncharacterized membrane protein